MRLMSTTKRSAFYFVFFAVLRLMLDEIHLNWPKQYFSFSLHASPVVRSLEFFCGMAIASFVIACRRKQSRTRPVLFTFFEVATLCLTVFMLITHQKIWFRAEFVILFCLVTFVFAFDQGWISKLLSTKPFRWFALIQMEFYIIHTVAIRYVQPRYAWTQWNWSVETSLACFVVTLLTVCLYRLVLKRPMEKLFDRMSSACFRFLRKA